MICAALIGAVAVAHLRFALDSVLAFWLAYILTRPLGASLGDYLAQTPTNGGFGLGSTLTSGLFVASILCAVAYLSVSRRDVIEAAPP